MKKISKLFILICLLSIGLSNLNYINAAEIEPMNGIYWILMDIDKDYKTETQGGWELFYEGEPATEGGEYDTVMYDVSYSHSVSASFSTVAIKDAVEAELGFEIGVTESFSSGKNSRLLKKGEYVKAYYMKNYDVHKVTEVQVTGSPNNDPYPSAPTRTKFVYEAINPKIKLTYHMGSTTDSYRLRNTTSQSSDPYMVEYYELIDDKWILTSVEYN